MAECVDGPVVIDDPGAFWCDGALVQSDGTLYEHQFHSKPLVSLIRRKIRVERSDEDKFVTSREISLFITGRCRRRNNGYSIYWHSYSDLVYILTGVTYCAQVHVECGRTLPDGSFEMYLTPRVSLVRARDPNAGITRVSWSKTSGIWPKDVEIKLVKLSANLPGARPPTPISPDIGMVGFPQIRLNEDASVRIGYAPLVIGNKVCDSAYLESKLKTDYESSLFLERASAVYRRFLVAERELETSFGRRREVINVCMQLSARKRLMLVAGSDIVNYFVAQVCLYGLGESNFAQEIMGVLFRRNDRVESGFEAHNTALANAVQLALILRRIQEYPINLPVPENRLDMTDQMVLAAQDFFSADVDVNISVICMAAEVLRSFSVRGSVSDAVETVAGRVPLTGCADRGDVVRILRL
ncbi:B88 [Murid betaherpesvirus 8]|uniref:B88 n=1 Tax=Rat cytomegalovirus (isolate England) TaxID=1261657 RepID=A0A0E3SY87_RCMVE|nr:B88 [Murid betaherpesvirus 8]WPH24997.1 B88 [Murid betaherpesvirus 8]WPH25131.1 B88 [Murid betaherpesvirus 8]